MLASLKAPALHESWAVLFLGAAYLQLNDPDPLLWILAYTSAACYHLCATQCLLPKPLAASLFSALPLALLAYTLAMLALHAPPLADLLTRPLAFELVREALGMTVALASFSPSLSTLLLPLFALSFGCWMCLGYGCM
jgi:hypothetical protein